MIKLFPKTNLPTRNVNSVGYTYNMRGGREFLAFAANFNNQQSHGFFLLS